jgi:hypothetical protein
LGFGYCWKKGKLGKIFSIAARWLGVVIYGHIFLNLDHFSLNPYSFYRNLAMIQKDLTGGLKRQRFYLFQKHRRKCPQIKYQRLKKSQHD